MLLTADGRFREAMSASTWQWIGLIFAIAVLAWLVMKVRELFRTDDGPAGDADQMLSEIREMYEEGKLSEEEFRSIKGRLTTPKDSASAARDT